MLSLLLVLGFSLLLVEDYTHRPPVRVAAEAAQEALLTGRDSAGRQALELLPGERIDINQATAEELQRLPGIGTALAEAIVQYRQEHGAFTTVEDLMQVKGIGEARFEAIRERITVG